MSRSQSHSIWIPITPPWVGKRKRVWEMDSSHRPALHGWMSLEARAQPGWSVPEGRWKAQEGLGKVWLAAPTPPPPASCFRENYPLSTYYAMGGHLTQPGVPVGLLLVQFQLLPQRLRTKRQVPSASLSARGPSRHSGWVTANSENRKSLGQVTLQGHLTPWVPPRTPPHSEPRGPRAGSLRARHPPARLSPGSRSPST